MLTPELREGLIIYGFTLLIVDRFIALYAVKAKAVKALERTTSPKRREATVLRTFIREFIFLVGTMALLCLLALGIMQIAMREALSNDLGRMIFALFAFVLSTAGSLLNVCVERLR